MNRNQICRILFLFTLCGMLIDGMLAQSIADIARQEREKRKARAEKQQEQEQKRSIKTKSTRKVYRNEDVPPENNLIPSPSPSPIVPAEALPAPSPSASPAKSSEGSSVSLIFLILGYVLIIVGGLWMLVVTFRTSVWWGLGCLFIPFVELFYLVKYWKEARGPFGLQGLGFILLAIALQIGS